jgi:hypothetical protein
MTHSLIMRDVSVYFLLLFVHFYLCKLLGGCRNVYPYTVTDDRVGRNKNRKDNGTEFSRRYCIRKFSYHETLIYDQRRFLNKHLRLNPTCMCSIVRPVSSFEEICSVYLPY